jgi:predicted permease
MGAVVEGYQGFATMSIEAITPGYFRTLGIPLRSGREFSERDASGAAKPVVIDEAFAKRYFANRNPIGMHLAFGGPNTKTLDREIVGVAADVRPNVRRPAFSTVYFPYTQRDKPAALAFYVRATGSQDRLAAAIRQTMREADAGLPAPEVKPIELRIRESLYTSRLVAALSLAFGILAMSLAAIGLYGVIAYAVARRTGEIGIRMALGADRANILKLVGNECGKLLAAGLALGIAFAMAASQAITKLLYGLSPTDALTIGFSVLLLALVALPASLIPAIRASRLDPMKALREE